MLGAKSMSISRPADSSGSALGIVLGTENFILAGDNANGSTTITDSSSNALTFTNAGTGVTNSTTQFVRGTASYSLNNLYFYSGSTAKAYMGASSSWTIDFFVYMTARPSSGSNYCMIFCATGGAASWTAFQFGLYVNAAGQMAMDLSNGSSSPISFAPLSTTVIPLNTWIHVAVTYNQPASQVKLYYNGVLDTTVSSTGFANISATPRVTIGRTDPVLGSPSFVSGSFLDRIRLTPSVRWTTNFTPD